MKRLEPQRWVTAKDWRDVDRAYGLPSDKRCRALAEEQEAARHGAASRKQRPDASEIEIREIGLLGARAAARALRIPLVTRTYENHGDRRKNLVTRNGIPVDVVTRKTVGTSRDWPDLVLRTSEKERLDLALLLVVWWERGFEPVLAGWLWEQELRELNQRKTFVKEENFVARVTQLRPFETLVLATTPPGPKPLQVGLL